MSWFSFGNLIGMSAFIVRIPYGVGCMIAGGLVYSIINKILKSKRKQISGINECVFFTINGITCQKKCKGTDECSNKYCSSSSIRKCLVTLEMSKRTLDICVYLITNQDFVDLILNVFKKGVFVRIITDKDMSVDAYGCKVHLFRRECIPLKVIRSDHMMHNKFVIVDKTILLTGSFNWTANAFYGNYENGIITSNENIVKQYNEYFQTLWDEA